MKHATHVYIYFSPNADQFYHFLVARLTARLSLLCKYPVCFSDGNVWAVIGLFLYRADPFLMFACVQSLNKPVPSSDGATWHGLWHHGWVNRDQLSALCQNFLEGGAFTSLMGCDGSQAPRCTDFLCYLVLSADLNHHFQWQN